MKTFDDMICEGGPAFPNSNEQLNSGSAASGMTLRDWFAGQALACMVSHAEHGISHYVDDTAILAYRYADAMLAERAKGGA